MFARLLSLQQIRPLAYLLVTLGAGLLFFTTASNAWATTPTYTAVTSDADHNGTVDTVTLTFNTAVLVTDTSGAADGFSSITLNSGCLVSATANLASVSTTSVVLSGLTGCTSGNTSITPTVTYATPGACGANFSICSVDTTTQLASAGTASTDGAKPILLSTTPTANATGVRKTGTVTLNFSEAVTYASFGYTLTPATSTQVVSPTSGSSATFTITGTKRSGANVVTVTGATDLATNVLNASNTVYVGNALSFRVAASESTDTVVAAPTYSALVESPNGGESLVGGATEEITWSASSSNGALSAITLSYSIDGEVWTEIATNIADDSSYMWTVPDSNAADVWIKVTGTDLITTLATDTSDASFSIESDNAPEEDTDDTTTNAPTSDDTGISPVTGEEESISEVAYGDYITSPSYDTVYYVDYAENNVELIRRPFMDTQTFMTWQDDFDAVIMVTDATLPTMTLGAPMLPKAGVVLVKIQSIAKVYAVHGDGMLHWVASEELAVDLYGSNWADYVIDIPDTLYPRFTKGADLHTGDTVDTSDMKTRAEVNS